MPRESKDKFENKKLYPTLFLPYPAVLKANSWFYAQGSDHYWEGSGDHIWYWGFNIGQPHVRQAPYPLYYQSGPSKTSLETSPLLQPLTLAEICQGPPLSMPLFTFCEAGVWIQVFLRLLHRDFFYFWFDINGTTFGGASIIEFLGKEGKGRLSNISILHRQLYFWYGRCISYNFSLKFILQNFIMSK